MDRVDVLLKTSEVGQFLRGAQHLERALAPALLAISLPPLPTNGLMSWLPMLSVHPDSSAQALKEHFSPTHMGICSNTQLTMPSSAKPQPLSLLGPPLLAGSPSKVP